MKKLLSCLLLVLLTFSMMVPALAVAEPINDGFIAIEVASDEEAQALLAEIEESNQRAQELWEAAVLQAEAERADYEARLAIIAMMNIIRPLVAKTVNVSDSADVPAYLGFRNARFYHTAKYDVITVSGIPTIYNVSTVNTLAENSNSSVSNRTGSHVIIDSGRTLAVSCSMRVGIKDSNGVWYYTSIDKYVEFYNSFTGRVY